MYEHLTKQILYNTAHYLRKMSLVSNKKYLYIYFPEEIDFFFNLDFLMPYLWLYCDSTALFKNRKYSTKAFPTIYFGLGSFILIC